MIRGRSPAGRVLGLMAVLLVVVTVANVWLAVAVWRNSDHDEAPVGERRGVPAERGVRVRAETRVLTRTLAYPAEIVETPTETLDLSGAGGVVTDVFVEAGGSLAPGDAIVEIDGRGVIGLPLPFPLYRDIRPGVEGRDVEVLQGALNEVLGLNLAVDGVYGPETKEAVVRLHEAAGLEPETISPEENGVPDLARQVAATRRQLEAARSAPVPDEGQIASLEDELASAEEALSDALDRSGPVLRADDVVLVTAPVPVLDVLVEVGDRIGPGALIRVSEPSPQAEFTAPEADLARLEPGDRVTAPGREGLEFTVTELGPIVDGDRRVRLRPLTGGAALTPGETVAVEFVAETTGAPVLAVPAGLVFVDGSGRDSVLVEDGASVRRVPVEIGRVIDGMVEIVDGLEPGVVVVGG